VKFGVVRWRDYVVLCNWLCDVGWVEDLCMDCVWEYVILFENVCLGILYVGNAASQLEK
jgi:hypothetical protein